MPPQESGHNGQLVSLGGVLGLPGRGRLLTYDAFSVSGVLPAVQVMPDNPRRIAALVVLWTSVGGGTPVICYLGSPPATNATGVPLSSVGDSLQIDMDFPWTGPVYLASLGGGPYTVGLIEVSVQ